MQSRRSAVAVGVIGLGIMGGAFARHLSSAGFRVTGFDVLEAKRAELRALGGGSALSAAEAASQARIIITSLPSLEAFDQALFDRNGVTAGARRGTVIVEASTLPLAVKERARQRLARRGVILLDCPVSGTGAQAAVKDIAVYASGDQRAYLRCRKVIAGFSRSEYYCGDFGAGSKLKYIANLLVTIHNLSTAEAMVLAERGGLDLDLVYRVIKDGAGSSRMFEVRGPLMVEQRYEPATMKVDVYQKDIAIIRDYAAALECPTPLFTLSKLFYDAAYARGHGAQDTAAVHAIMREVAGLTTRRAAAKRRPQRRKSSGVKTRA